MYDKNVPDVATFVAIPKPTPQSDFRSASTIDSSTSSQTIQEEKQKRKRIQLLSKDINSTRERLLALPQLEEHGEYTGSCEIILNENVSLEEYLDYRDKNPSFPVRIYLHDGKIKAYEIPLAPHSMVSAVMFSWNNQELEYGYDTNMIVGQNSVKEPDSWVRPEDRPHLKQWTDFIVLVIKIFDLRVDNTFVLIAALYLRTNQNPLTPVNVISFGTADPAQPTVNYIINMNVPPNNFIGVGRTVNGVNCPPCNMAGIPMYQMNIPAAELFDRDPNGIPAVAAGGFNLDLWELLVKARKGFNV
ncbi:uncharacterized protein OCT59_006705 [Rhizophagus irregularis]|uniref:Uncharacterized protein n=1 Tax=Rhizophagus irregularis TaxID=588596 RepID=A0A916E259_9GLOM|nr:hypothetical protein OCT59_006705 [Rhizophagus irregularis]CAB5351122.1 unnamed protein product [Rhizophagus irregularis]